MGQLRSPAAWRLIRQNFPLSIGRDGGEFRLETDIVRGHVRPLQMAR